MTVWRVKLTPDVEADVLKILAYTYETFGPVQYEIYKQLIQTAVRKLESGPAPPGSASRETVLPGLRSYHIRHAGGRGSHFLIYREASDHVIEILRILHEAQDFARHIPKL